MLNDVEAAVSGTIAKAMADRRITQKKVADALGVRPQTVSKWANGETLPPMRRWEPLEQVLELSGGTFYRLIVERPQPGPSTRLPGQPSPPDADVTAYLDAVEEAVRALRSVLASGEGGGVGRRDQHE